MSYQINVYLEKTRLFSTQPSDAKTLREAIRLFELLDERFTLRNIYSLTVSRPSKRTGPVVGSRFRKAIEGGLEQVYELFMDVEAFDVWENNLIMTPPLAEAQIQHLPLHASVHAVFAHDPTLFIVARKERTPQYLLHADVQIESNDLEALVREMYLCYLDRQAEDDPSN